MSLTAAALLCLGGCSSSPEPMSVHVMAPESSYGLYSTTMIQLTKLSVGKDVDEFWDEFSQKALTSNISGNSVRIERLSPTVVRIERTNDFGTHIAVHFAIFDKTSPAGRQIRLQPLSAWLVDQIGTGQSELMLATNARETVEALRGELPQLAYGVN
ncbi:hypothetical protein Q4610_18805 [Sphingobium sp. HBC34]|uniref:DUF3576 domain-containing protein n=1 Tax=Sphingobium cyanobacteriorum TaxID=3063954 RepID=A0ABT8ZSN0_9SPHN|nr:hypothetical protein [Sphingobium sp. HBC34]MDO7837098.1 hypothetical protein [Sphingobium sp. HBC34]